MPEGSVGVVAPAIPISIKRSKGVKSMSLFIVKHLGNEECAAPALAVGNEVSILVSN